MGRVFIIALILVFVSGISYAMCGMCGVHAEETAKTAEKGKAVEVGNKICPVSGDKIDEKSKVTYKYEGKIYNLCCPACIEPFKKDPKKYSGIAEKEVESGKTK